VWRRFLFLALFCVSLVFGQTAAFADNTIRTPGDHPDTKVEIEPHALVGLDYVYASSGIGLGARFSIPVVKNGFIPSLNNSVAVSLGLDLLHYAGCYYANRCVGNYVYIPVAMQWNFFVAKYWSVMAEPGVAFFTGFFDACNGAAGCVEPTRTGLRPAFYIGGRYHMGEHVALTMRIGYPAFSIGISFL